MRRAADRLAGKPGLSSYMWQHLIVRLADRGFRCVALDRRGHGRSEDAGKGYDFDRFADDISQLLTQLNLCEATLVGHSVGGAEAARCITRHGTDRVTRLVLASAILPFLARTDDIPDGIPWPRCKPSGRHGSAASSIPVDARRHQYPAFVVEAERLQ
jgi:pimeloyl-ACP methyl ester carboxylesterase